MHSLHHGQQPASSGPTAFKQLIKYGTFQLFTVTLISCTQLLLADGFRLSILPPPGFMV